MNEHGHEHEEVPITIDRKPLKSPNPTTGAALYILGGVQPQYDLFRETHGHGDDELIPNSPAAVTLKPGDRFYSAQRTLNPGGPRRVKASQTACAGNAALLFL